MPLQKLLNKFNGLHYSQEYLCMANGPFQTLHTCIVENGRVISDITNHHCFVGYCPLIFAFPSSVINRQQETIDIVFSHQPLEQNVVFAAKDALAQLSLKKIYLQKLNGEAIIYYRGLHGQHRFSSRFHQMMGQWSNYLYNRKPGNVFLKGNLYKQVQISYAIPRKISLVTVGNEKLYNHFPTDLHGQVDEQHYIISLRRAGAACKQVEASGTVVLSDIEASAYGQAYALGKNHMQPLKALTAFDFDNELSRVKGLPLPKNLISYKELELKGSFEEGIHKLLLFKILHNELAKNGNKPLTHIHNRYATWLYKKGFAGNYLLR
jgi:hypothetical protein